jgi:hypothetical protein
MAQESLAKFRHASFPKQRLGPANRQPGHDIAISLGLIETPSNVRMS